MRYFKLCKPHMTSPGISSGPLLIFCSPPAAARPFLWGLWVGRPQASQPTNPIKMPAKRRKALRSQQQGSEETLMKGFTTQDENGRFQKRYRDNSCTDQRAITILMQCKGPHQ